MGVRNQPYYADASLVRDLGGGGLRYEFWIMKRATRGGDREIAKCYTARSAELVVKALNALAAS